jgi:hypothetical protein
VTDSTSITIIDALSGTEIVRELNSIELSELETAKSQAKAKEAELQAQEAARKSALAKLAALGLTEAEIAAL